MQDQTQTLHKLRLLRMQIAPLGSTEALQRLDTTIYEIQRRTGGYAVVDGSMEALLLSAYPAGYGPCSKLGDEDTFNDFPMKMG